MDERLQRALPVSRQALMLWAPVARWAALIFILPAQPDLRFASGPGLDFVIRKFGHMGVFGILDLLLWRALAEAFALTVLYAASDEFHQGFAAGRHPSVVDIGIDATGPPMALLAVWLIRSRCA